MGVVLVGVVLAGWSLRSVALPTPPSSSPLPLVEHSQSVPKGIAPQGEPVVSVPTADRSPEPVVRVAPTPSVPALVPNPPQQDIGTDPFRAYRQIVGAVPPRAVPTPRPLATQTQTLPPPPVAPLPVLPAPPTVPTLAPSAPKPQPLTLRERLQASGWTALAVGVGAEPVALLSRPGEQGLYRVGETLEERIRIERIQSNRVILARDNERAALEVLP